MNEEQKAAIVAEPWKVSAGAYQTARGVHQPWIAEISPAQYGMLSKRQKDAYNRKRDAEWSASSACKEEWRALVIAAYDAGTIKADTEGISEEARSTILLLQVERRKQGREDAIRAYRERSRIAPEEVAQLQPGTWIFAPLGRYMQVLKVNAKSVRTAWAVDHDGKPHEGRESVHGLSWLSSADAEAGYDSGLEPWEYAELLGRGRQLPLMRRMGR